MMYGQQLVSERARTGNSQLAPMPRAEDSIEAIEDASAMFGRRWKLGILFLLARGKLRYNAMMRELPGATPKMLTQQLRALEDAGLISRVEYTGGPKHTEYALTAKGESFVPIVEAFSDWACQHWNRDRRRECVPRVERDVTAEAHVSHVEGRLYRVD
jgi:DNA-binding HxlR family transcriptional regulator